MEDKTTAKTKFRIVGSVQHVGYRNWLKRECEQREIKGWVRNENDNSVTTLLVGNKQVIEELAGLLRLGPDNAEVLDATPLQLEDEDRSWQGTVFDIVSPS